MIMDGFQRILNKCWTKRYACTIIVFFMFSVYSWTWTEPMIYYLRANVNRIIITFFSNFGGGWTPNPAYTPLFHLVARYLSLNNKRIFPGPLSVQLWLLFVIRQALSPVQRGTAVYRREPAVDDNGPAPVCYQLSPSLSHHRRRRRRIRRFGSDSSPFEFRRRAVRYNGIRWLAVALFTRMPTAENDAGRRHPFRFRSSVVRSRFPVCLVVVVRPPRSTRLRRPPFRCGAIELRGRVRLVKAPGRARPWRARSRRKFVYYDSGIEATTFWTRAPAAMFVRRKTVHLYVLVLVTLGGLMVLGALIAHDGLLRQQTFDGGKRSGNHAGRHHICSMFALDVLSHDVPPVSTSPPYSF